MHMHLYYLQEKVKYSFISYNLLYVHRKKNMVETQIQVSNNCSPNVYNRAIHVQVDQLSTLLCLLNV